jgi:hypothetical protein
MKLACTAQAAMEYLIVSVFAMVIVVVLFSASLATTSQSISAQQTGESLDNLVQTIDLVYAMGPGNIQFAEVSWPIQVTSISIWSICKTDSELKGCPIASTQGAGCTCNTADPLRQCSDDPDCIKSSAIKVTENSGNELLYPTKARLVIPGDILINNFRYKIKASWTERKLIRLDK